MNIQRLGMLVAACATRGGFAVCSTSSVDLPRQLLGVVCDGVWHLLQQGERSAAEPLAYCDVIAAPSVAASAHIDVQASIALDVHTSATHARQTREPPSAGVGHQRR